MHKFFVEKENIHGDIAYIEGDDVKHIYRVLRLEEGEEISINNCNGEEFLGKIQEINKKEVRVSLIKKLDVNNESNINIHLFQGLPKSTKMDLIAQKATELGVNEITPIMTARVEGKTELAQFKKVDRWNRIALEACKQCKRSIIPKINSPMEWEDVILAIKELDLVVVPYENSENYGMKNLIRDINKEQIKNIGIIIGPEGGFEEEEIKTLKENGCYIVTLGPRILRTETAGFVCSSLLMYELGDTGGNV